MSNGLNYHIYVMNLERSVTRRESIKNECSKAGLDCHLFKAIDGYKINVTDLRTNQTFTGYDIKNMPNHRIEGFTKYIVTCNPEAAMPIKFGYAGIPLSAGELGIWCSYRMIWLDAESNNYKLIIILEDDVQARVSNLSTRIDSFISNLPSSFDLGFMHYGRLVPYSLLKEPYIQVNDFVFKLYSDIKAVGAAAIVYSDKAISTLLSYDTYISAVDVFFWDISLNDEYKMNDRMPLTGLLEIYMSTEYLFEPSSELGSQIFEMGRSF